VGVRVGVGLRVGVRVRLGLTVSVRVGLGLSVGVRVRLVTVKVRVGLGLTVAVRVGLGLSVGVQVRLGILVAVRLGLGVGLEGKSVSEKVKVGQRDGNKQVWLADRPEDRLNTPEAEACAEGGCDFREAKTKRPQAKLISKPDTFLFMLTLQNYRNRLLGMRPVAQFRQRAIAPG
jgi:hypothetical protein